MSRERILEVRKTTAGRMSAPTSLTRQNRKAFQTAAESMSSSLSSNDNSSGQFDDDNDGACARQPTRSARVDDRKAIMNKLQSQVKDLRHKVRGLEECIDHKEDSLGALAREKDRLTGEVRRLERSNKLLKQQLNDERTHYMEEKEKFCEEMSRYKKRVQEMKISGDSTKSLRASSKVSAAAWQKGDSLDIEGPKDPGKGFTSESEYRKNTSLDSLGLYEGQDLSLKMAVLRTENAKLKAIVNDREERNYELCLRFLRMKHSKNNLRHRFQDLENEYLKVISNLMEKIDEAREEFNFIIDQKFKKPIHPTNAKYLRLIQRNSKIALENIKLRMEVQQLKKELSSRGNPQLQNEVRRKDGDDEPKKSSSSLPDEERKKVEDLEEKEPNPVTERTHKVSDTDSNYMSKTSTTYPSTGSLAEGKSTENMCVEAANRKNKPFNAQNFLISSDILQKIFETVDSEKSEESPRDGESEEAASTKTKADMKGRTKRKSVRKTKSGHTEKLRKMAPCQPGTPGKRYVACPFNTNKFHEVTKRSNESKKGGSRRGDDSPEDKSKMDTIKARAKLAVDSDRRPKSRSPYTEVKHKVKSLPVSEKASDTKMVFNLKGSSSWNLVTDTMKSHDEFVATRRYRSRKERRQRLFVGDSCGLEEKIDSDGELTPDYDSEALGKKVIRNKVVDQLTMIKHDVRKGGKERTWKARSPRGDGDSNSEDSVLSPHGGRDTGRNDVSLHDELMEATKLQSPTDDPFWRRELNLHTLITNNSVSPAKELQTTAMEAKSNEGNEQPQTRNTKQAGKKDRRALKSSMKRRKSGLKPDTPQSVNHKTTSTTSPMMQTDGNSEVVLRFLMPPVAILSNQSFLSDGADREPSCLNSARDKHSTYTSPVLRRQASNAAVQMSDAPSMNNTADIIDSSYLQESLLSGRTFSAPALLESEWLSGLKMYEVKDCSTNT